MERLEVWMSTFATPPASRTSRTLATASLLRSSAAPTVSPQLVTPTVTVSRSGTPRTRAVPVAVRVRSVPADTGSVAAGARPGRAARASAGEAARTANPAPSAMTRVTRVSARWARVMVNLLGARFDGRGRHAVPGRFDRRLDVRFEVRLDDAIPDGYHPEL